MECDFRITNDGIDTISPFLLGKRVFSLTESEMLPLLRNEYTALKQLNLTLAAKCEVELEGCLVFSFTIRKGQEDEEVCFVPVWRGKGSVNILVNKIEKGALYMRLTGDTIVFEKKAVVAKGTVVVKEADKAVDAKIKAL